MSILCGWAANGENGARGNKAGDQSGREVHIGSWYDFGQTAVYRWRNREQATKYAKIIKALCQNDNVGYDQDDRSTLYNLLKKNKWDYKKVDKKVECDCSSLVGAAINCTVGKDLIKPSIYTGNLGQMLMKTGLFEKLSGSKYCDKDDYLMVGDIINKPSGHVISSLANGSKSGKQKKSIEEVAKEVIDGKWDNGAVRKKRLEAAGYDYQAVQAKVNELTKKNQLKTGKVTATKGLNVRNKPSTETGKILRTLPKGTTVTCYGIAKKAGRTWWKISKTKDEYAAAQYIKANQ